MKLPNFIKITTALFLGAIFGMTVITFKQELGKMFSLTIMLYMMVSTIIPVLFYLKNNKK